ncbi:MAG: hypothetical protein HC852_08525 [Acaryochloridaceae cyanobacterium RU_4_10]|nr:hypothetical protein [Acaryochloridaceae cyanobacterium RU_4_10]
MDIFLTLTEFLAIFGIGYFCIDSYRHRQRTILQLPSTDAGSSEIYDVVGPLDCNDLHAAEQTVTHVGHTVGETTQQAIAHSVDVISHALSHH